ncbi:PH domain-containing protein [uncultured Agrococcus sp.]|uniref:PH domain-containing protein n=1 Tax=uncultured Agrococcus sp. TaxID=382258 RepID=UPI0025CC0CB4|nr:PH domain-containing protein [uncultured Agrococcus sp.]
MSRTNRGLALLSAFFVVSFGVAMGFYAYGLQGYAIVAVGIAWLLLTIYFCLWRPSLEVSDNSVRIVNPLRTVEIPWSSVTHVDTKFSLTIFTPFGRFAAACAPQPGQLASRRAVKRAEKEPNSHTALDSGVRIGDLPGTESGDAAALVRDRWETWRDRVRDAAPDADAHEPAKRPNYAVIATMVLMPLAVVVLALQ